MDTRLPYFDGQKDFLTFLRFLDNRKEYEAYIKQLDTKVVVFLKAAALYGKAKDIERKHEEAELWVKRAEHDYHDCAEREEKLTAGEKALANETRDRRAKMKKHETEIETLFRQGNHDLKVREATCKAREGEVAKLEAVVAKAEQAVQKKTEAAVEAKRAADDMVKRMKAATVVETA